MERKKGGFPARFGRNWENQQKGGTKTEKVHGKKEKSSLALTKGNLRKRNANTW